MSPTKDRLNEMKQIRNGRVENIEENNITIENSSGKIGEAFQKASEIRTCIQIITTNTKRANEILKTNLFKIDPDLQDELDSLFITSTTTAYKINNILKQLEYDLQKVPNTTSTEYRIKSVQVGSLKAEFQEALKENSISLEYHKNKRKELLKKSLKTVTSKNINDEELEALLDENKLDVFTDNHLMSTIEARQQLSDIEDRHKELIKIEKQLYEVSDLFVKLGTLVEQQQEYVNRVEFHASSATEYVEKGIDELSETVKSRRKCRKRRIFLVLIIVAVVLCIILMLVL